MAEGLAQPGAAGASIAAWTGRRSMPEGAITRALCKLVGV
jgi:hypothetical protein